MSLWVETLKALSYPTSLESEGSVEKVLLQMYNTDLLISLLGERVIFRKKINMGKEYQFSANKQLHILNCFVLEQAEKKSNYLIKILQHLQILKLMHVIKKNNWIF